jgi:uncharacterized protein (UPF0212 family)
VPDYLVVLESAWVVRDVKSLEDAISVAISEAGKRLNPTAKFVEIESGPGKASQGAQRLELAPPVKRPLGV